MNEQPYRTLARPTRVEIDKIKGSRFIASGFPFGGEERLAEEIDRLRDEFRDADHHGFAWRDGERFRYADDGEPSGSAGRPILRQIDGAGLDRVAVVVTRIFGGTRLGVGGLARAYGAAARELLARAAIAEVVPSRIVTVTVPYELLRVVEGVAKAFHLAPVDSAFDHRVRQSFDVPLDRLDALVRSFNERTAGRAGVEIREPDDGA